MKKFLVPLVLLAIVLSCSKPAKNNETEVAEAVSLLQKTIVHPDAALFDQLTDERLSYGHSAGLIEDQKTFINSLVSGKYKFVSIDTSDQTIEVVGNTAIVRHTIFAQTHDKGKDPGAVRLKVMQVWCKEGQDWRLVARQAVKI
jgi:ketosteroid isomerase-like protein